MNDRTLTATLTRTRTGAPLAVVDGLPGGGADLTPEQLRALAAALVLIAADAESNPARGARGKALPPLRRDYPLPT